MAKKKEEVNLSEIDASFVISSFKNKERRNNPSSIPRALVPDYDSAQEKRARELAEQDKDEEAVVENEFDDKEKEEVKNALKAMNRQARAEHLAKTVLNKKGLDAGDWDAGRLAGAFRAIALNAKAELKARSETAGTGKVVNGALPRTGNGASEGPSRMFNVFNKKETK